MAELNQKMQALYAKQGEHLRQTGLWSEMDASEQEFLLATPAKITMQQLINNTWLAEAAACLLWALELIPQLPAYDVQADPKLTNSIPQRPIADLLNSARLRPFDEITKQRDIAELWHWRARTRRLQESGKMPSALPQGLTIEHVIQIASAKAAENGEISAQISGDFPAFNKAYRDLTAEEFSFATSIAQERHRALNWLCGYALGNRWADTPTDT